MSQEQKRDELVYVRGALYGAFVPVHVLLLLSLSALQIPNNKTFGGIFLLDLILITAPFTFYPVYNVLKGLSQPTIIFLLIIFWSVVGIIFAGLLKNRSRLWKAGILAASFILYVFLLLFFENSFAQLLG